MAARRVLSAALAVAVVLAPVAASAADGHDHAAHAPAHADSHADSHAAPGHGSGHGDSGGHGSAEINWAHGFVGEKEGVSPSLLYRPKGMPAPFLATVINAALLFGILYSVGKKPVLEALKKRKADIVAGIDEASRMKAEAAARLADYEAKLAGLDAEIDRLRAEMREAVEAERRRILSEAKERRERMERDARTLVEQELKAARETLVRETVASAMVSATRLLGSAVGAPDHDRLAREYLEVVGRTPLHTPGGPS